MTIHLDLDMLADVLAGEAAPEHLDTCPHCQARLAELAAALPAVDASLAALPVPAEPADLQARLEAALVPAPTNVLPLVRPRTRWLPALGAVAAAAVLVTGGVVLTQGGSGNETTASDTASHAVSRSGNNYAADGKALLAALPQLLAGNAKQSVGAGAPESVTSSQGGATLDQMRSTVDSLAVLRTPDGLASCLASLTDPSVPGLPLALDYAQYAGQPALVVVLASSQPEKVDVFVVGSGCTEADAKVLLFTRLAKP